MLASIEMSLDLFQVPGGPAQKCLEPGDVLVCINGEVSYAVRLMLTFVIHRNELFLEDMYNNCCIWFRSSCI